MSFLLLEGLSKRFGSTEAVHRVSLEVERGEVLALLGPSGSGKTTLLRLLGGFERPDEGRIRVGGDDVTSTPPERRRFGMVFQHYALFPHLTVAGNVAFGLAARRLRRAAVRERVSEVLSLVELPGFEGRKVEELSGGQQQRVALARALAPEPRVLLLDEPLSNLDPSLRERTRGALAELVRKVGITTVLVTHEQEEAFDLGDRVAVLRDGRLEQVGSPEELYARPRTRFVAGFVGRASFLPVQVAGARMAGERVAVRVVGEDGVDADWSGVSVDALEDGAAGLLALRPEALALDREGGAEAVAGTVDQRRFAGATSFYRVRLGNGVVEVLGAPRIAAVGDRVWVRPAATSSSPPRIFPGEENG